MLYLPTTLPTPRCWPPESDGAMPTTPTRGMKLSRRHYQSTAQHKKKPLTHSLRLTPRHPKPSERHCDADQPVGPTYLEAHTAWKVGRVAVDAAEEQAKAIRAANAEIYRDAHVDFSAVDYADDALTVALNGEVLGGAGYSAFRDSFRESCQ